MFGVTAAALANCRLTAHVSIKLNRSHLVTGEAALILPCLSRTELDQVGSVENTVSWISPTRGIFPPISPELRSEAAIVCSIADELFGSDWSNDYAKDYRRLRDKIARIVPGFENFNQRLDAGGFYAPVPAKQREFRTASGKAEFIRLTSGGGAAATAGPRTESTALAVTRPFGSL